MPHCNSHLCTSWDKMRDAQQMANVGILVCMYPISCSSILMPLSLCYLMPWFSTISSIRKLFLTVTPTITNIIWLYLVQIATDCNPADCNLTHYCTQGWLTNPSTYTIVYSWDSPAVMVIMWITINPTQKCLAVTRIAVYSIHPNLPQQAPVQRVINYLFWNTSTCSLLPYFMRKFWSYAHYRELVKMQPLFLSNHLLPLFPSTSAESSRRASALTIHTLTYAQCTWDWRFL